MATVTYECLGKDKTEEVEKVTGAQIDLTGFYSGEMESLRERVSNMTDILSKLMGRLANDETLNENDVRDILSLPDPRN